MEMAIVYSGNARFVGNVVPDVKPGTVTTVYEAFELISGIIAVPRQTPGGMTMQVGPTTTPVLVDGSDRPQDIEVFVSAIRYSSNMGKQERAFLEQARMQKAQESEERRAAAVGLERAGKIPGAS